MFEKGLTHHYLAGISSLQIQYWGSKGVSQAGLCWPGRSVSLLLSPSPLVSTCPASASVFLWPLPFGHLLHLPPWLWQGHSYRPSTFMLINCPRNEETEHGYCVGTLLNSFAFNLSWTSPLLTGQFFWPWSQPFVLTQMPSLLLTALTLVFIKSYLCKNCMMNK